MTSRQEEESARNATEMKQQSVVAMACSDGRGDTVGLGIERCLQSVIVMRVSVGSRDIDESPVCEGGGIGPVVRCVRRDRNRMYHQNFRHRLNVLRDDFLLHGQDDRLRVSRACINDETRISTDESKPKRR